MQRYKKSCIYTNFGEKKMHFLHGLYYITKYKINFQTYKFLGKKTQKKNDTRFHKQVPPNMKESKLLFANQSRGSSTIGLRPQNAPQYMRHILSTTRHTPLLLRVYRAHTIPKFCGSVPYTFL